MSKRLLAWSVGRLGPQVAVLALSGDRRCARSAGTRPGLRWVPDLLSFQPSTSDRGQWYRDHGLDPGRVSYLVIGELSGRKCVPQILRSWSRTGSPQARLLLVGNPDEDVRRAVAGLAGPARDTVVLVEGYQSEGDFDAWIAHADVVLVVHRNLGASGVLAKAAVAGTPVLVGGPAPLTAAAAALGLPAQVVDVSAAGLDAALSDPALPARLRAAAGPAAVRTGGHRFADALLGVEGTG
jgi:hypothetical protein